MVIWSREVVMVSTVQVLYCRPAPRAPFLGGKIDPQKGLKMELKIESSKENSKRTRAERVEHCGRSQAICQIRVVDGHAS